MKRSLVIHDLGDHSPAGKARVVEYLANRFELSAEVVGLRLKRLPFVLKDWVDETDAETIAEELSDLHVDFELSHDEPSSVMTRPSSSLESTSSSVDFTPPSESTSSDVSADTSEVDLTDSALSLAFDESLEEISTKEVPADAREAPVSNSDDNLSEPSVGVTSDPTDSDSPFSFQLTEPDSSRNTDAADPVKHSVATKPSPVSAITSEESDILDLSLQPEPEEHFVHAATKDAEDDGDDDFSLSVPKPSLNEEEKLTPPPRPERSELNAHTGNGKPPQETSDRWPGEVVDAEPVDLSKEPTPLSGADLVKDLLDPDGSEYQEHGGNEGGHDEEISPPYNYHGARDSKKRLQLYAASGGVSLLLIAITAFFLLSSDSKVQQQGFELSNESIDVLLAQQNDILRSSPPALGGRSTAVTWWGQHDEENIHSEMMVSTDLNNVILHNRKGVVEARLVVSGNEPPKLTPEQIVAGIKETLWVKRFDGRSQKITVPPTDANSQSDSNLYQFEATGPGKAYLRQGEKNFRVVGEFRVVGTVDVPAKKIAATWEIIDKEGAKPEDGKPYIERSESGEVHFYYSGSLTATPEVKPGVNKKKEKGAGDDENAVDGDDDNPVNNLDNAKANDAEKEQSQSDT